LARRSAGHPQGQSCRSLADSQCCQIRLPYRWMSDIHPNGASLVCRFQDNLNSKVHYLPRHLNVASR
jgi:hypothetical protein